MASSDDDLGRNNCEASDGLFLAGGVFEDRLSVATMSSNAERTCSSKASASGVARLKVAARLATKRSRSADRVDDGSLHSSGAGTGAGHDARRGRGGAGGPSRSGAVWGASDARRFGLSCCTAAAGCCPFAPPPSSSIVRAVFAFWSPIKGEATASQIGTAEAPAPTHSCTDAYHAQNQWSHTCISKHQH